MPLNLLVSKYIVQPYPPFNTPPLTPSPPPGSGKIQAYVVVASGLGLMALLLDTMGVSMTIPASTCELELDTFRKGVLNCVSFLGIALTAHLWGFLADTIGRNKSIRYSLIGSILLTGAAAFVPNFWALIVLRLLSGMR